MDESHVPKRPLGGLFQEAAGFLRALVAVDPDVLPAWFAANQLDVDAVEWLHTRGLAPYAFYRLREVGLVGCLAPAARNELQQAYYRSSADAALHDGELHNVLVALAKVDVGPVLLKGAALAHIAYGSSACRPMGDLDLWLTDEEINRARPALERLNYVQHHKTTRPAALQATRGGEIQLVGRNPGSGVVELHWGAFAGEWLERVAAIDEKGIRSRCMPIAVFGIPVHALAAEDAVLHLAAHLAVNHQFAYPGLRGLLDIVMTARWQNVDWDVVALRAREWRIATVVWLVQSLATNLFGLEGAAVAFERLKPSRLRRWLLSPLVTDQTLLEMRDLTRGPLRFVLLLLLVDRTRDAVLLFWRTLWPEGDWLAARYGLLNAQVRIRHLRDALQGKI